MKPITALAIVCSCVLASGTALASSVVTTTITGQAYAYVYEGPFTLTYVSDESAPGATNTIGDPYDLGITSELSGEGGATGVVVATLQLGSTTLHFSGAASRIFTLGSGVFDVFAGPVINSSPNVLFGFGPEGDAYGGATPSYRDPFSLAVFGSGNFSYYSSDSSHTLVAGTLLGRYATNTIAPAGVPEPGAWAMLLAGLGVLGAPLRFRRKQGSKISVSGRHYIL